jgi:hypothetical protein
LTALYCPFEQAKLRSEIRIKDGRAKPIDILANYIHSADDADNAEMDMQEPYAIFTGLNIEDIEDLHEDIKVYQQMEQDANPDFWRDMLAVATYELEKKQRFRSLANKKLPPAVRRALDIGITPQVEQRIVEMLRKKNTGELEDMQRGIKRELEKAVDVQYWERMVIESEVALAKARLRSMHQTILEDKLSLLKAKSLGDGAEGDEAQSSDDDDEIVFDEEDLLAIEEEEEGNAAETQLEVTAAITAIEPPLLPLNDDGDGGDVGLLDPEADLEYLYASRRRVLAGKRKRVEAMAAERDSGNRGRGASNKGGGAGAGANGGGGGGGGGNTADDQFMRQQRKKDTRADADEEEFNVEASLAGTGANAKMHLWREKYKPRKPRFFNKVHTGFEWNKYNQTHYDMDNPPPKIVQGYKFNLFYPDLVDQTSTPTYTLIPIPGEPGFALLKFSAGPPYEEIAWKVVDRKWEYAFRSGFRCQFQNGQMQLHFHFQREKYRR